MRIEHWRTAQQQGKIAARNMLGQNVTYDSIPFFWTQQFGKGLRYVGHATRWDEIVYHGEVPTGDFLAFYIEANRIVAVAGMKHDREMAAIEELMRLDRMPSPEEVKKSRPSFVEMVRTQSHGSQPVRT